MEVDLIVENWKIGLQIIVWGYLNAFVSATDDTYCLVAVSRGYCCASPIRVSGRMR